MKKSTKTILKYGIYALAILYLLSPIDIIPDAPFIGLLDDLAFLIIARVSERALE